MVFLWDLRASCTLFTTVSADLKHSEVSFFADLRASCTLFTTTYGNVNYSEVSFLNRPPCVLHIIYNNLCDSEVRPTRDFIILNKSPTQPPRHEEDIGLRILVRFPSRVRAWGNVFFRRPELRRPLYSGRLNPWTPHSTL